MYPADQLFCQSDMPVYVFSQHRSGAAPNTILHPLHPARMASFFALTPQRSSKLVAAALLAAPPPNPWLLRPALLPTCSRQVLVAPCHAARFSNNGKGAGSSAGRERPSSSRGRSPAGQQGSSGNNGNPGSHKASQTSSSSRAAGSRTGPARGRQAGSSLQHNQAQTTKYQQHAANTASSSNAAAKQAAKPVAPISSPLPSESPPPAWHTHTGSRLPCNPSCGVVEGCSGPGPDLGWSRARSAQVFVLGLPYNRLHHTHV